MIRFVDGDYVTLDELIGELGSEGTCDVVVGGRTKQRALHRFAQALHFPSWSGHNLDALYELLDERAHAVTTAGADWTLIWSPSPRLTTDHPRDYARVLAVLADVADPSRRPAHRAQGARVVIVHGAGLSVPAPEPRAPDDPSSPRPGPHPAAHPYVPDPHPDPRSPSD